MAIYDHPSLLFYCGLLVDVSNDLSIKQVPIVFRPFDRFIRCEFLSPHQDSLYPSCAERRWGSGRSFDGWNEEFSLLNISIRTPFRLLWFIPIDLQSIVFLKWHQPSITVLDRCIQRKLSDKLNFPKPSLTAVGVRTPVQCQEANQWTRHLWPNNTFP